MHTIQPQLAELGVSLVAVLHEALPEQVAEFASDHWKGGELYLDETQALYAVVGGGTVRKGSLAWFLNPLSRIWANAKAAKGVEGNFVGDGLTMGGLLVINKAGEVTYAFQEENFGDRAPVADVLRAATEAASQ